MRYGSIRGNFIAPERESRGSGPGSHRLDSLDTLLRSGATRFGSPVHVSGKLETRVSVNLAWLAEQTSCPSFQTTVRYKVHPPSQISFFVAAASHAVAPGFSSVLLKLVVRVLAGGKVISELLTNTLGRAALGAGLHASQVGCCGVSNTSSSRRMPSPGSTNLKYYVYARSCPKTRDSSARCTDR